MKNKTITKKQVQYSEKCTFCGKEIIGTSESQVKYNLKVHAMQIHNKLINLNKLPKSKDMIKEIKKEVCKK